MALKSFVNGKAFSQDLYIARTYAGVTQRKLAQYLGVSVQTVSNWECGSACPSYNEGISILADLKFYSLSGHFNFIS